MSEAQKLSAEEISDRLHDVYERRVKALAEDRKGKTSIPQKLVRAVVGGKPVTSSDLDNFKDAVECYYESIPQVAEKSGAGATGTATFVPGLAMIFVPSNAELAAVGAFGNKMLFDEVEIVKLFECNDKTYPLVGQTMKSVSIVSKPEDCGLATGIALSYNEFSFKRYGINKETGAREGVIEEFGVNLVTGAKA